MHNNVYYFLFEFLATKPKDLNKDGEHKETDLTDARTETMNG